MITFQYPYSSPTTTIQLRNPELEDIDKYSVQPQIKTTMDGSIATYKRTPARERFQITINGISKADMESFLIFLTTSSGRNIGYTDHEGTLWKVIIITDPKEFATINSCGEFTITMELVVV